MAEDSVIEEAPEKTFVDMAGELSDRTDLFLSLSEKSRITELAISELGCTDEQADAIGTALYRKWVFNKPKDGDQRFAGREGAYEEALEDAKLAHGKKVAYSLEEMKAGLEEGGKLADDPAKALTTLYDTRAKDRSSRRGSMFQTSKTGHTTANWEGAGL